MEINYQILETALQKLIFFQDEFLQKQIEKIFGKAISITENNLTWRELVENLCSFANDLKSSFEEENIKIWTENLKLNENLDSLKKEKLKLETDLMVVEKILKEIYERKLENYEEKVHKIIIFLLN